MNRWPALNRVTPGLRRNRAGGREKVREEGHCRMCLRPATVRKLTRHHLVPRTWFEVDSDRPEHRLRGWRRLRDADANIVPLCRICHDLVEFDIAGRKLLRKVMLQAEIAFCIQTRGQAWLDETYPPSPESAFDWLILKEAS